ncbi:hypothetical protein L2E82_06446 [Cichorium intybus]|uniref:Uncharacterized protein n=1 Tax=Cichorium intybus TaxID=13427 RepID=A0ACB9H9K8_CICIN|nr:hypothetical protein L2E82_06446 [Cichorium intybus]
MNHQVTLPPQPPPNIKVIPNGNDGGSTPKNDDDLSTTPSSTTDSRVAKIDKLHEVVDQRFQRIRLFNHQAHPTSPTVAAEGSYHGDGLPHFKTNTDGKEEK